MRPSGHIAKKTLSGGVAYYAVADYGMDAKGRRIRRWSKGFGTEKGADKALRVMLVDEDWIPSNGSTVESLVESYISSCVDRNVEKSSIMRYTCALTQQIAPFIGNVRADALRGDRLDKLYGLLLREGGLEKRKLSATTVKFVHDLLNSTYRWAVRKRFVSRNPVAEADPPRRKKSKGQAMTVEDAHTFLGVLKGHRMEAPLLLSIATGMRRGEVAGLRTSHLDLSAGVIRVCESLAKGDESIYVKGTKTGEPREVPLNTMALEALKIARVNRAKWKLHAGEHWEESDYIFTDEIGARLHPNVLSDAFRRLRDGLKMTYSLHDLRHTAATFMLRSGLDLNTVQQILGHSVASTTLNIYGHVMAGAKRDARGRPRPHAPPVRYES